MRELRIVVVVVLLVTAAAVFAQESEIRWGVTDTVPLLLDPGCIATFEGTEFDRESMAENMRPRYFLMLRYWGYRTVFTGDGGALTSVEGWEVLRETYGSLEEVYERLNDGLRSDAQVVGLWDLEEGRLVRVRLEVVVHERKVEVETRKRIERVWHVGEAP